MDNDEMNVALTTLFKYGASFINNIPPRERRDIDGIEVVFMDVINKRFKHNRAFTFQDILEALSGGGTPIGLILLHWHDPDKVKIEAFPDIPDEAMEVLTHALAETQDEMRQQMVEEDDD